MQAFALGHETPLSVLAPAPLGLAMIFLFLEIDKPSVTNDHWIYFPAPEVIFNRISEMRNFSPDAAPSGKTSLTLEITCDIGDEIWTMPEEPRCWKRHGRRGPARRRGTPPAPTRRGAPLARLWTGPATSPVGRSGWSRASWSSAPRARRRSTWLCWGRPGGCRRAGRW